MYYSKSYYPTPPDLIQRMLEPYMDGLKNMTILEPSAGMGAICDYLRYRATKSRIYCVEVEPSMQATLRGKDYNVIHDDFLTYSGSMRFDLIVMNPPFEAGAAHLLKAWEIMRGGDIVCLLNAETIRNPHTKEREILNAIIEKYGTVEFVGNAFANADRKTNVEVALVRLKKTSEYSGVNFNMQTGVKVGEIDLSSAGSTIERTDYISALVRSYGKCVEATENLYKAMTEVSLYASPFADNYAVGKMLAEFFNTASKQGYVPAHNQFVLEFQRRAWDSIFSKTKASDLMTEKVRAKFDKWRTEMGGADLNEANISMLFDALIQQRQVIAEECITEVFDRLTYYAHGREVVERETWKTNSAYLVQPKFILPHIVDSGWSGGLSLNHSRYGRGLLDDIDRALCMVSGRAFSEIQTTANAVADWCSNKTSPTESEFFTFSLFQKGSGHFKFKDDKIRIMFNRRACEKKGWQLPAEEKFRGKARRS